MKDFENSVNMISLLFTTLLWIPSYDYIIKQSYFQYPLRVNEINNQNQGKDSLFPGCGLFLVV